MNSLILKLLAIAAFAYGALALPGAASATNQAFEAALQSAGYILTVNPVAESHTTLSTQGKVITIQKGTATARLELFQYASQTALEKDWLVVNGQGPKPRVATSDFDGRVLYWNQSLVLAIDTRAPNDAGTALTAADIFLGRRGTGGPAAAPGAPVTLPSTGAGDLTPAGNSPALPLLAFALGVAGIAACVAATALAARRADPAH